MIEIPRPIRVPHKTVAASNRNLVPLAQPIKGQRSFVYFNARAPTSGQKEKLGLPLHCIYGYQVSNKLGYSQFKSVKSNVPSLGTF